MTPIRPATGSPPVLAWRLASLPAPKPALHPEPWRPLEPPIYLDSSSFLSSSSTPSDMLLDPPRAGLAGTYSLTRLPAKRFSPRGGDPCPFGPFHLTPVASPPHKN